MTRQTQPPSSRIPGSRKSSMSMHENVPVWHDSCSCEAEPYWVEAMSREDAPRHSGDSAIQRNKR